MDQERGSARKRSGIGRARGQYWIQLILVLAASQGAEAATCDGGSIILREGSTLEAGWTGTAHNEDLAAGASFDFVVSRRCSDSNAICSTDDDCANQDCTPTCDCQSDKSCEIAGPVQQKRCIGDLKPCETADDCTVGTSCVPMFGPPLPVASGQTPLCIVTHFDGPISGTADFASGDVDLAGSFRWRHYVGELLTRPCPRCGAPDDSPEVGQQFTCEGGQFPGATCTVDAVTPLFGGTSFQCPPQFAANVTGNGQTIRLTELTTGETTRDAELPCKQIGLTGNPLVPGSNPKCLDTAAPCTSNADCRRCTADSSVACSSNADCTDKGSCGEAPEQPISCGFWCHCGFCDANPAEPCFGDVDCAEGKSCVVGPGSGTSANGPQARPNNCTQDQFVCGETNPGECATTLDGTCSEAPWQGCGGVTDEACDAGEGECVEVPRSCFDSRVTRTGSPDASQPDLVALYCMAGTSSATINTRGLTGPNAMRWETDIELCDCGNSPDPSCEDVCSFQPVCGNSVVDPGEPCDGGPCCESGCTLSSPAKICRTTVGGCDVAETCTGSGASCPADSPALEGTPCDDSDACTADDVCSGHQCEGTPGGDSCGDATVDGDCETCDDGNTTNGDGCSSDCHEQQRCGDANNDGAVVASDALRILQRAIGLDVVCAFEACDVDGSGAIRTRDALQVLIKSVGGDAVLACVYD